MQTGKQTKKGQRQKECHTSRSRWLVYKVEEMSPMTEWWWSLEILTILLFHHGFNEKAMLDLLQLLDQSSECDAPSNKAWEAGKKGKEKSSESCSRSKENKETGCVCRWWRPYPGRQVLQSQRKRDLRIPGDKFLRKWTFVAKQCWEKILRLCSLADACVSQTLCRGPCLCELFAHISFWSRSWPACHHSSVCPPALVTLEASHWRLCSQNGIFSFRRALIVAVPLVVSSS